MTSANNQTGKNLLGHEHSPYLLQHKNNPVFWYPWGREAFSAAQTQDKPIFLSIGYATCYWCHVMEKDSFEHQVVADVLNQNFICIKLDREERPDIDQIYMDVVIGLTGHGGWPMSVFLTPDLKPFWGGTFFYQAHFIEILQALSKAWREDRENIQSTAQRITEVLHQRQQGTSGNLIVNEVIDNGYKELEQRFDAHYGGFGSAPKFPPTQQLRFLLRLSKKESTTPNQHSAALKMAAHTLTCMAKGGIYDQLGGGFHRYSTDARWLVPHFEKMLYDNALLVVTYLEAYQITKDELFASTARETLNYVQREMQGSSGQFFCAQDAGAVGKEGEYYVWKFSEIKELLSESEFQSIVDNYQVTEKGNFEHATNILVAAPSLKPSLKNSSPLSSALKKLRDARAERTPPLLDDKILTGWNGLMISAFSFGFRVLGDQNYLSSAQHAAHFIRNNLCTSDGELLRRFHGGDAAISAMLEDYAYLISGLIELYQCDFDPRWLEWACSLQQHQDRKFWNDNAGYLSSTASDALVQQYHFSDDAIPSANAVSLGNLRRLFAFFGETELRDRRLKLLSAMAPEISHHPTGYCSALLEITISESDSSEFVIVAGVKDPDQANNLLRGLYTELAPGRVIGFIQESELTNRNIPLLRGRSALEGRSTVYECKNGVCDLPKHIK